jgi:D-amino peptidase
MKILIMTDMEGVAGVLNCDDWVVSGSRFYDKALLLLTEEVNAAVDGFVSAGADDILVVDGHGAGGIDPLLLDSRALLLRGRGESVWPWGLDETFSAIAFVGQHAKAGSPYSHITHTQNFAYLDMTANSISIGEYGQLALCAKEVGVPTILACGEEALCTEAEALTPGVVTVSGKRGLLPDGLDHLDADEYRRAKLSAVHKAPQLVRALIREAASKALRKLRQSPDDFQYPDLTPPYVRTIRFRRNGQVDAYETRDDHPSSLIAMMNLPIAPPPAAGPG